VHPVGLDPASGSPASGAVRGRQCGPRRLPIRSWVFDAPSRHARAQRAARLSCRDARST